LQNGWNVSVATPENANKDGSRFEGIGMPPELIIIDQDSLNMGINQTLEMAIKHFR
jgi:hypothetical protein